MLTVPTLRAVFRLALRQAEGLVGSMIGLLGLELRVPDHSPLMPPGRDAGGAALQPPRGGKPLQLLVDSSGLRSCGVGE